MSCTIRIYYFIHLSIWLSSSSKPSSRWHRYYSHLQNWFSLISPNKGMFGSPLKAPVPLSLNGEAFGCQRDDCHRFEVSQWPLTDFPPERPPRSSAHLICTKTHQNPQNPTSHNSTKTYCFTFKLKILTDLKVLYKIVYLHLCISLY